jgi:predicted Fe-Mo cluster-binding NifX family protein/ribosomal protein L32
MVMRIAIPTWQGRIAPVFDVAGHLLLVDVEGDRETRREEKPLLKTEFSARATELVSCGANLLICGAISAALQLKLMASGVKVIAFVCGAIDDVLTAYLNGTLGNPAFAMPGCRRWRWRGGEDVLPVGFGMGRRRGRFGQGPGRAQSTVICEGSTATAAGEFSTCPKCGEKIRRKTGSSQARNVCPKCGASTAPF